MGTEVHQGDLGDLPISLGEAAEQLKQLAPVRPIKRAIEQAAKAAGLSYTRAFDLWYGKARRIEAHEAQAIAEALDRKARLETRNELQELRIRLARLESRLAQEDPEFHREAIGLVGAPVRARRQMVGRSG